MKKWMIIGFFAVLGMALLCGCTSTAPRVTPTPQIVYVTVLVTPSTPAVAYAQDPIIGVWRSGETDRFGTQLSDIRYHFYANGTFVTSWYAQGMGKDTQVSSGTWNAEGGNFYKLRYPSGADPDKLEYDPARDIFGIGSLPAPPFARYPGDVMEASASAPSGSTHLSGNGDDVVSFSVSGTGLKIFTMNYTGKRDFAVKLKDGSGDDIAVLANETGSYSGKKSEKLTSGRYYLDVTADGPWTIDITSV